jgi:hypothetical protein
MSHIPTPEAVTAQWLTEQLNANGVEGTVKTFEQQRVGTGQIGMCVLLRIYLAVQQVYS